MSVEFIGYIGNNYSSETIVRNGPVLDRHYIETVAKAHESAVSTAPCWRFIPPRPTACRSVSMCLA